MLKFVLSFSSVYALNQVVKKPLPYDLDALEPVISKKTIDLHYNKHHSAYVNNLNKAIAQAAISNE